MERHQIEALIQKYVDGLATAEEIEQLNQWYRDISKMPVDWPFSSLEEEYAAKRQLFGKLKQQIHEEQSASIKAASAPGYFSYLNIAAAAVLIAGIFLFSQSNIIRRIFNPAKQLTVSTAYGVHKSIRLADGSNVWLGPGSSMSYPDRFEEQTREITFEGEAFFDIAKDARHPFIVHTGKTNTRVLGTSFSIKAYKEQKNIEVALLSGKVTFSAGQSTVSLEPNQKAIYNRDAAAISKVQFDNAEVILARRDGEYQYFNVNVEDIADDLKRNFNIKINIKGGVNKCLFYGRIKKDESVEKFLKKMGIVVNASVTKHGESYLIKGGGCR